MTSKADYQREWRKTPKGRELRRQADERYRYLISLSNPRGKYIVNHDLELYRRRVMLELSGQSGHVK